MRIDIRKESEQPITEIQFSDNDGRYGCGVSYCMTDASILICDCDDDPASEVLITDIPNLIKALEKAYELWGKK